MHIRAFIHTVPYIYHTYRTAARLPAGYERAASKSLFILIAEVFPVRQDGSMFNLWQYSLHDYDISLKTQELYLVVYITRYLDLFTI